MTVKIVRGAFAGHEATLLGEMGNCWIVFVNGDRAILPKDWIDMPLNGDHWRGKTKPIRVPADMVEIIGTIVEIWKQEQLTSSELKAAQKNK